MKTALIPGKRFHRGDRLNHGRLYRSTLAFQVSKVTCSKNRTGERTKRVRVNEKRVRVDESGLRNLLRSLRDLRGGRGERERSCVARTSNVYVRTIMRVTAN